MTPAHRNLRELLAHLRVERELVEVDTEVDPRLEIAEIHRRVIAADGPALLFTRVRGSPHPVVTNLYGTRRRVELAFGTHPDRWIARAVDLARSIPPVSLGKLWGARDLLVRGLRAGTRRVTRGPILSRRVSPPELDRLPVLTSWPQDGGPFFTWPLVYTESPENGTSNLGVYRMQLHDPSTTGMHWQIAKGGGFHHHAAEAQGVALPVNVFLGGPPLVTLAAVAPLPENVPELLLASFLLGEAIDLAADPHGPLPLLAEAEFALVGEVLPAERRPEGPFGDHYGYYSLVHDYPVFRCKALYARPDPIFPATIVGKPRQEDFLLGDLLQELLAPVIRLAMPAVLDLWAYGEAGYHSLAAAVVRERFEREAMGAAFRILGEGQLSLTKFLIVLDSHLDLRDARAVLEHALARVRWETDLFVFDHQFMDTLDYSGRKVNHGSRGVLLGLGAPIRDLPRAFDGVVPAPAGRAVPFAAGCLVVDGPDYRDEPDLGERLARSPAFAAWPLVILVDDAPRAASTTARFLWTVFTRFEPAGDLHAAATRVERNHLAYTGPIVIDARRKPWFPEEVFADEATDRLVTDRWRAYFPGRQVEMGPSSTAHLDRQGSAGSRASPGPS